MRIGMMADIYKPHISGVTNYIELNKRYLEKAGQEVFVFTFGEDEYQDDEPNIIRSPSLPFLSPKGYGDIQIGLRYDERARRLLHTMDVVHVHHPIISMATALRHCKPRGIPIVFTHHSRYDLTAQAMLPLLPDGAGELFEKAYFPSLCQAVDLVVAPSPSIKEMLQRLGVDVHIEIIPHGVELTPFRENIQPLDRGNFGFKEEEILLIYVGRLSPEKNLPFLLRSFFGAVQAFPTLGLLLVGDGPEWDNLHDLASYMGLNDRIRFIGMVNYKDLPSYLTMADIFVTPSTAETFGLSVVEAMASGLPVLGINTFGICDNIEDGVTGFLAPEDLASFTAKMVRLITDRGLRLQMGARARMASDAYAIEKTVVVILDQYRRLLDQSSQKKQGLTSFLRRLFSSHTASQGKS